VGDKSHSWIVGQSSLIEGRPSFRHLSRLLSTSFLAFVLLSQDDRMGRILGHLESGYYGQCLVNYRSSPKIWATFSTVKATYCIGTKNMVGLRFGRLFHKLIWSPCNLLCIRWQIYACALTWPPQSNSTAQKVVAPAKTCSSVQQGDQIGRIFAYWAFVYFGQFFSLQKELKFLGNLFPQYKKVMHQF
jgi:hypothetical protein